MRTAEASRESKHGAARGALVNGGFREIPAGADPDPATPDHAADPAVFLCGPPAGLDSGAVTLEEIALSIVAEMVEVRRRGQAVRQALQTGRSQG
jgi:hypothetical protein